MKPKVFWYMGRWWCRSDELTIDGDTPRGAYFRWMVWA